MPFGFGLAHITLFTMCTEFATMSRFVVRVLVFLLSCNGPGNHLIDRVYSEPSRN